ncbi:nuclease-related domain-containing protein [Neobacillus drentensis]|uniref:nuclease-related domain-containing protein n=1 Tax=Neobacillus drentensis TaxID=220684 RepID=UPI002FFDBE20
MIIKKRTIPLVILILEALCRRLLPIDKYMILHDLNLPDGDSNCQIDTLLLTPEFALIVEVKNMAGKLIFDTENEQFTQINNDKEKGYQIQLLKWKGIKSTYIN